MGSESSNQISGEVKDDGRINQASAGCEMLVEEDGKYDDNDTVSYKLHIAIDFGTDGIGLAFAIEDEVYVHEKFISRKYGASVKPKTIVLLDEEGEVNSLGIDAKFTLSRNYYLFCQ